MITVKVLDNKKQIDEACALLYDSYVESIRWNFSPSNPSNIKIEVKNGHKILTDRFTGIAKWFGAFDGKKLVGCFRLCGIDKNNAFEIEKYPIGNISKYLQVDRCKSVDINRIAVNPQYIKYGITKRLFLKAFEYCRDNEYSIFACTHNKHLINLFKKINYPLKQEKAFKYELLDEESVNFYYAIYQMGELSKIIGILREQLK